MRLEVSSNVRLPRLDEPDGSMGLYSLLLFAAKGSGHAGVEVHIKAEPLHLHGYCYCDLPSVANVARTTHCLITLHMPPTPDAKGWPRAWWNSHGLKRLAAKWPAFPFDDWRDAVVYIAAHEFRHFWQRQRKRRAQREGRAVTGKLEHDASSHGLRMVNKYRELTGRLPIVAVKQPNPFASASPAVPWSRTEYDPAGLAVV